VHTVGNGAQQNNGNTKTVNTVQNDLPDFQDLLVRNKLLTQLGEMDPLQCLPKVYCQISSDEETKAAFFR